MVKILGIYKAIPYTGEARRLLTRGFKIPYVDMPSADDDKGDLSARLESTRVALEKVEQLIAAASDPEKIILHNAFRLPIIELRQQLTEEARANMQRTTVVYSEAQRIIEEILYAAIRRKTGSPHKRVNDIDGFQDEVTFVSASLLDAEGQEHETHGVSRVPDYADAILQGRINPQGKVELMEETYAKLSYTGGGTFGQVAAQMALQGGLKFMNDLPEGSSLVVTMRHAYHAGRLEWIVRQAVKKGFACLALFNVGGKGRVAPEDGMEPRWGTNPIAFGVPTGIGEPGCIGDTATTARSEGWVNVAHLNGLTIPLGIVRTPEGEQTIDPGGVYRKDGRPDLLVPIGGDVAAYKGAVLGEMIDLFVNALSGRTTGEPSPPKSNNLVFFLCKVSEEVITAIREQLHHIESCPTASDNPIRRPGAQGLEMLEKAKRDGLSIAQGTWQMVVDLHKQL